MRVDDLGTPQFIQVRNTLINICEIESVSMKLYTRTVTSPEKIEIPGINIMMTSGNNHLIEDSKDAEEVLKILQYYKIRISD